MGELLLSVVLFIGQPPQFFQLGLQVEQLGGQLLRLAEPRLRAQDGFRRPQLHPRRVAPQQIA